MAGWLHGVFVGEWLFVFPLFGFSLSLFCNYPCQSDVRANWIFAHSIARSSQMLFAGVKVRMCIFERA